MEAIETKVTPCPYCGAPNDQAHGLCGSGKRKPGEGDLGVCWRCGGTLRYNANLEIEKLTESHLPQYHGHNKMLAQVAALSLMER